MNDSGLKADISARYKPFLDKVLENHQDVFGRLFALLAGVTQADYYEIPEADSSELATFWENALGENFIRVQEF